MVKCVLVLIAIALCALEAQAQAPGRHSFAWDYPDHQVQQFGIVRFELRFDGGSPVSVGMSPLVGAPGSYYTPLREMPSGQHAVEVRACSPLMCFGWSAPMLFVVSPFFQAVEVGSFGALPGTAPE